MHESTCWRRYIIHHKDQHLAFVMQHAESGVLNAYHHLRQTLYDAPHTIRNSSSSTITTTRSSNFTSSSSNCSTSLSDALVHNETLRHQYNAELAHAVQREGVESIPQWREEGEEHHQHTSTSPTYQYQARYFDTVGLTKHT